MPRYKLIIEKKYGSEYWVNDYHYTASDFADADSKAQPIVDAEIATTAVGVTFTLYRISTVVPNDGLFMNFPLNTPGTATPGGDFLALWNVLRVDFPAVTGRAGRKYLRGALAESDVNGDVIVPAAVAAFDASYAAPLRALDYLEKASGVLINDCVINPTLAMRQLRRGSKRKARPIIS